MRSLHRLSLVLFALLALTLPMTAYGAIRVPALSEIRSATALSGSDSTYIVSGTLSNDVALPGVVVLPMPKGGSPVWVGQVLGGDPSLDPTATYEITRGRDFDYISITMDKSRTAQAEFFTSAPASQGGQVPMSLSLPIIGSVDEATLQFWVEKGSVVASASKGVSLQSTASSSYDIYSVTKKSPKKGSVLKASVTVGTAASSPSAPAASGGSTSPAASTGGGTSWQGLLGLLLVVGAAGAVGYFGVNAVMTLRERGEAAAVRSATPAPAGARVSKATPPPSRGAQSAPTRRRPPPPSASPAGKEADSDGKARSSNSTEPAKRTSKNSKDSAGASSKTAPKPRKKSSGA